MKELVLDSTYNNTHYLLFFNTKDLDKKGFTTVYNLQRDLFYSSTLKNVDKKYFLKNIILGKIILTCNEYIDCFILSPSIEQEYYQNKFNVFFNKKIIKEDNDYVVIPNLNYEESLSVAYFLYLNNYYTEIDEYTGTFFVKKRIVPQKTDTNIDTTSWVEINKL